MQHRELSASRARKPSAVSAAAANRLAAAALGTSAGLLAYRLVSNAVVAGLAGLFCLVAGEETATTRALTIPFRLERAGSIFGAGVVWSACPGGGWNLLAH